jgi:hypothetical protein
MQRTRAPTPFTPALRGRFFGVDFNPMVDRIRVTSDANQNIRLHPDDANVVGADADLNPGDPTVVGSAYTNSSFSAGLASSTVLYALDALDDAIYVQSPPNNGTLAMPQRWTSTSAATAGSTSPAGTTSATSPPPPIGGRGRSSTASTSRPATASSSAGSAGGADHRPRGRAGPLLEDPPYSERGRATARGPAPRRAAPLAATPSRRRRPRDA